MKLRLNKVLFLSSLLTSFLYAENIKYKYHDIHNLTPAKNTLQVGLGYKVLNDTVDILKIKESEFGGTKQFNTIGDMSGYKFWSLYALEDDFMLYYKNNEMSIEYGTKDIVNSSNEIYARYNFHPKGSIDFGFIQNKLYDFYITDLDDINEFGKRYFGSLNFDLKSTDNGTTLTQSNQYTNLEYNPWIGVKDTSDISIYLRAISSVPFDNFLFDYYAGVKYTMIKNSIVSNNELSQLSSEKESITLPLNLDRDEMMFFLGFNFTYSYQDIFIELGYKYDKFKRDEGLDYISQNHTIDMTLGYEMTKKLSFYLNGKVMSNQLNGQIPYLYNQYTQTTYDHKYGYIITGVIYNF